MSAKDATVTDAPSPVRGRDLRYLDVRLNEAEVDPTAGTVSYVSRLASTVIGRGITTLIAGGEVEIVMIT